MRKIYVYDPKPVVPVGTFTVFLCYSLLDWTEGEAAIPHVPGSEETRVELLWGDGLVEVKQKTIDNVVASFGVTSNDIIFLGGWN
jgi:hypothetical protein